MEARVRIYAVRDALEPAGPASPATAEKPPKKVRLDAMRQAALVDAAARAGMAVALEPGREGSFLEATGALDEAKEALDDLWRMGFSGYMAETDRSEAEDELARFHGEVVWDVALVDGVRRASSTP